MITRLVKMVFDPTKVDTFETMFLERRDLIAGFKGCLGVELLKDVDQSKDGIVYFTRSIWINEDHLNAYRNSDLFADTWTRTKACFAGKPEAWSTNIVSTKFE